MEEVTMYEQIASDEIIDVEMIGESRQIAIIRAFSILKEREKDVLMAFFGFYGESSSHMDRIYKQYRLTKERVRQIKDKALSKLATNKASLKLLIEYRQRDMSEDLDE